MSATKASRPSFCPFIYTDGVNLFLEFDNLALRFPFSEGGLSKALKHIPNISRRPGFLTGGTNLPGKHIPKVMVAKGTIRKRTAAKLKAEVDPDVMDIVRKRFGS